MLFLLRIQHLLHSSTAPLIKKKKREKAITPDEAIAKLEHYCAYRERHTQEVLDKIAEYEIEDEQLIEELLLSLRGHGFLDDERFARFYASGKMRMNHWGKVRIRIELNRKKLPKNYIDKAIEALDETEYRQIFEKVKMQKLRYLREKDPYKRKKKLTTFLAQKGFEFDMIFEEKSEK